MKRVLGFILIIMGLFPLCDVIWENDIVSWLSNRSSLEKSIPVPNIDLIQVRASSAEVEIIPSDHQEQDLIKVVLTGRDINKVHLKVDRDFNKAWITIKKKWYAFSSSTHRLKLLVYVPKHLRTSMKIELKSGNIKIGNSKKWNLVNLDTNVNSGKCQLTNVKLNRWQHNGTSGNITGYQVSSKETRLNIISGNIGLSHFAGAVKLSLTSGNVSLQLDRLIGDIKTDITSGNISLDLPQKAAFSLKAYVVAGKVKSNFPLVLKKQTDETTTATYRTGKYQIETKLMSGNLTIH